MNNIVKICIFFIWSIFFIDNTNCQTKSDIELVYNQNFVNPAFEKIRVVKFGISENKHSVVKYNPINITFSALLYTYQKYLSQQISADCLFVPSCSEYTRLLFKRYGLFGGIITSADRLMRCDRISATAINHVSVNELDGKVHESVERYKIQR